MKPLSLSTASVLLIALVGCTTTQNDSANADPAATLDAGGSRYGDGMVTAGNPDSCIQTNLIRNSNVISNRVIDFEMTGGRTYRNILPIGCPQLGSEKRFAYRTTVSQLCSSDTITVLRGPGLQRGPTCGLGRFQPVQPAAN